MPLLRLIKDDEDNWLNTDVALTHSKWLIIKLNFDGLRHNLPNYKLKLGDSNRFLIDFILFNFDWLVELFVCI